MRTIAATSAGRAEQHGCESLEHRLPSERRRGNRAAEYRRGLTELAETEYAQRRSLP
jgi:hypothetical protein